MSGRGTGWVDVGNGERLRTMEVVESIRRYRGRLTIKALCAVLGYDVSVAYRVVWRLARHYHVPVAAEPPHGNPDPPPDLGYGLEELLLSRRCLAAEIASYKDNLSKKRGLKPYKPGPLEW